MWFFDVDACAEEEVDDSLLENGGWDLFYTSEIIDGDVVAEIILDGGIDNRRGVLFLGLGGLLGIISNWIRWL